MGSILETLKDADTIIRKHRPFPIIGGSRLAAFMEKNWGYCVVNIKRSGK